MMALLRLAVLQMSLYERGATYGSTLQNLKYRNEWNHSNRNYALSFRAPLSFSVIIPYLFNSTINSNRFTTSPITKSSLHGFPSSTFLPSYQSSRSYALLSLAR